MRLAALALATMSITAAAPAARTGRSMVLLVDVTESCRAALPTTWGWQPIPGGLMKPPSVARLPLWGPIREFRDALQTGDRATIGAVADHLILDEGPVLTRAELENSAWRILAKADGAVRWTTTPLWDAVDESVSVLESEPGPRMVILVTDGKATGNRLGTDDVARHALAAGVAVHIVLGLDSGKDPEISASTPARRLAEATGGLFESYAFIRWRGFPGNELEGPAARMKKLLARLQKR